MTGNSVMYKDHEIFNYLVNGKQLYVVRLGLLHYFEAETFERIQQEVDNYLKENSDNEKN
jgi:hypothetical protein